ncbi:hypothetical protein [Weizmannia sp. FSL W8-0401]|uniref:hypothetical protein n=1 Tax=Weizmannia sp. FSL W8-0401 TaxID=2954554 RepID=UPI0030F8E8B3
MNLLKKAHPEGWLILLGAILMLVATILHPPLVDPYDLQKAYHAFKHAQFWIGDHILMLIAISLWLAGLAESKTYMARNNKTADFGAGMIFVALAVWILILASELTILPILGNKGTDVKVWEAVFSFGLLSGYFGFACSWIGIFCYGMTMKQAGGTFPKWFSASARWSGLLAFFGIIITCLHFDFGYFVIPVTVGPVFLWTIWLAVLLLSGRMD